MPFITQERRQLIAEKGLPPDWQPGDLCYIEYKQMVEKWRENPRWTTAHEIYRDNVMRCQLPPDHRAARELAWQVFFNLHLMKYELEKQEINGDV